MRTKNSILNMIGAVLLFGSKVFFNFIGKTILIVYLGDSYNGINSLFTNIVSMLSIAELGIGSAIIYNLYKPVEENDTETIKSIMHFYKRCYHIISVIVLVIGISIMPIVPVITGQINVEDNIYVLYIMFLADSVASYILSYKRSIIYVNQKNYITSYFDILYYAFLNIGEIIIIIMTHNYIFYLVYMVICRVIENTLINYYVNKKYKYLTEKVSGRLKIAIRNDIIKKVKGLMFHQVGGYIVFGTDNIIISKMLGVINVGLYSNYLFVLNPINSIISQVISSVTASVGNLLLEKNMEKNYNIYKKISIICFWLYSCSGICILFLMQDFVKMWLGEKYLYSDFVLVILVINFYLQGMRSSINVFKTAAGIYYEDRFVPLIESLINIIASIILVKWIGISGVILGTIISTMILYLYSLPFIVYKRIFKRTSLEYIREQSKYFLIFIGMFFITYITSLLFDKVFFTNIRIIHFIVKSTYIFIISNIQLMIIFYKNQYIKELYMQFKNYMLKKLLKINL